MPECPMFETLASRIRRICEEKKRILHLIYWRQQLCHVQAIGPGFSRWCDFSGICAPRLLIPKFVLVSVVSACFAFWWAKANIFCCCLMKTCSLQGNDTTKWKRKQNQWHEKNWELRVLTACVFTLTCTHSKSFIEVFYPWKQRTDITDRMELWRFLQKVKNQS